MVFLRKPAWSGRRGTYEAALDRILENLPFEASHRYTGGEADEQTLYQFATKLISRYVNSIAPSSGENGAVVTLDRHVRDEVDVLKQFIWEYVILNPDIAQLQVGQRLAVRVAFENSLRAARESAAHFFPEPYRGRLGDCSSDAQVVRLAADYVAGMTERELIGAYQRLQGIAPA